MRAEFLTRHFGNNKAVQEFVLEALKANRRDVAREVSRTVKRFGPPVYVKNFIWRISRVTGWESPRYPLSRRQRSPSRRGIGVMLLLVALMILIVVAVRR